MSLIRNKSGRRLHTDATDPLLWIARNADSLTLVVLDLYRHDIGAVIVTIVTSRVAMSLRQVVSHDQASLALSLYTTRMVRGWRLVLKQEVVRLPIGRPNAHLPTLELVLKAVLIDLRVVRIIRATLPIETIIHDRSQLAVARSWHGATLEGLDAAVAETFSQRVLLPILLFGAA